jgi:nitroimidazol reductase NimA-like FMN-containing flavoprotein (pyridoxamine 5'-phosphate oxidase superfamily)
MANKVFAATERSRLRRLPKRGHYDSATVNEILDAGFICHIGYVINGRPFVTPTSYWRRDDHVYWHGSHASRMLESVADAPVCLTVTHVDALVLARSGFHSSINYRSAMLFGTAHKVQRAADKLRALEDFAEHLYPGRWRELRPPTRKELLATTVVAMRIDEASAKIRTGPPVDDDDDYQLPIWAGVVPLNFTRGTPQDDGRLVAGVGLPDYLRKGLKARKG